MKLTNFEELWGAVRQFNIVKISMTPLFLMGGIDTDLEDIFEGSPSGGLITVLDDGTVRKTIIYISERKDWYDDKGFDYPKYHLFGCQTIQNMTQKSKKDRYKKTGREDDSFFMLRSFSDGKSETFFKKLYVCGYCLKLFNEKYKTNYKKSTFLPKNYYEVKSFNELELVNFREDYTTAPSYYTKEWKKISEHLKKRRDYYCEKCGVHLKNEALKKYLHTHHTDSNPSNNVISNLKVLCIECHAEEFNHGHIKTSPDYYKYMDLKKVGKINESK